MHIDSVEAITHDRATMSSLSSRPSAMAREPGPISQLAVADAWVPARARPDCIRARLAGTTAPTRLGA